MANSVIRESGRVRNRNMEPTPSETFALIEQSEDLHVDAMRATRTGLDEVVERGLARRAEGGYDPEEVAAFQARREQNVTRKVLGMVGLAGTAFGAGLARFLSVPASAAGEDVAAGQTAAALENLAIAVYGKAAELPFMQNIPEPAGSTVVSFVTTTVSQHADHAKAFNAAVKKLGGKEQTNIDQVAYDELVEPTLPTLKAPVDVVKFAATLELIAAETYAAETASVDDDDLRNTFSSIMGVENQHRSILLAVQALLKGGAPQLIEIPPKVAELPAAAGSVGFPDNFLPLDQARPTDEGAVK
jgi:rubrerythrin